MKASLGIPLSPNVGCVLARGEIDLTRTDKRAAVGERYAKAAKLQRPATVSEAVDARRTARGDECSLLCRFLDAGNNEGLGTLSQQASKKRQGTKSREVGLRLGSEGYGDLMSAPTFMVPGSDRDVCGQARWGACNGHLGKRSERSSGCSAH